jgi:repressor LexA
MIAKIEKGQIDLPQSKIEQFAEALNVSPSQLMGWFPVNHIEPKNANIGTDNVVIFSDSLHGGKTSSMVAPVLGKVAAGIPIEMITDILDTEELDPKDYPPGDYFGLVIQGDSMEPKISEGDVVIVRQQPDVESGQIAIVTVNGDDATCKKVMKYGSNLRLVSFNPRYEAMQFSAEDVEKLPVKIIGRVVELRAKF